MRFCQMIGTEHFLNLCLHVVNWTTGNKFQPDVNRNTTIFKPECEFEIVVWKMETISSPPPVAPFTNMV